MTDTLFAALVFFSCGFASLFGGRDGRYVSLTFLVAWLGSLPVNLLDSPRSIGSEAYLSALDLAILVALSAVARTSRRYWPLWVLGFHFANMATDWIILLHQDFRTSVGYLLHAFWSVPELLVMPIGIQLDRAIKSVRNGPNQVNRGSNSKVGRSR